MTRFHALVSAATVSAALAFTATPVLGQVPNPTVTGPIPENAPPGHPSHDYTFFTSEIVDAFGYVEEEFFIEGTANVYDTPPLTTGTILSSGHPYKTRIVVRRPVKSQRFNGTVILEWQNVTAGYDIDASWVGGNAEHFMREGYVWIGVSAQRVGIHEVGTGLREWSPVRYASLDITAHGSQLRTERWPRILLPLWGARAVRPGDARGALSQSRKLRGPGAAGRGGESRRWLHHAARCADDHHGRCAVRDRQVT